MCLSVPGEFTLWMKVSEHSFSGMGIYMVKDPKVRWFDDSKPIVGCRYNSQEFSMLKLRVQATKYLKMSIDLPARFSITDTLI